ncbi:MAG: sigma-70 family RNA polymerase sigma factor [Clostridia bacterium]
MSKDNKWQVVADGLEQNRDSLYRVAYSYMNEPQAAMDVVQECAYKALKSCESVHEDSVRPWLFRILVNTALDALRHRKWETPVEIMPETPNEDTHEASELMDTLHILDEKSRTLIILHYFEDMKLVDIAKMYGENLNTIKSRQRRALQALRIELKGAPSL